MSPGAAEMVVTVLGCGSSGGVPRVGQGWGRCDPSNPRNRRRRCSILVQRFAPPAGGGVGSFSGPDNSDNAGPTTVLVDMSPDLREQLIDAQCEDLDATVARLKHRGLEFDHEPKDQPWLWREARLRDPAGNVIVLFHAGENRRFPPWRVDGLTAPGAGG